MIEYLDQSFHDLRIDHPRNDYLLVGKEKFSDHLGPQINLFEGVLIDQVAIMNEM